MSTSHTARTPNQQNQFNQACMYRIENIIMKDNTHVNKTYFSKAHQLSLQFIIIINPLTARVVGAPQMIFCNQFSPFFPVLHCPLGLAELQACPFPDVVFLPLPLSTLPSSPFLCAVQDGFGQTWWTGNMTIPLQFASLYDRQEIFMWSNCLLDLGMDFLVGNMVFVWDV